MFIKSIIALVIANVFAAQTAPASEAAPAVPRETGTGNYQENDSPCERYSICGSKGRQNWQNLLATVKASSLLDTKDGHEDYIKYYKANRVDRDGSGQEVTQDLVTRGLSPLEDYQKWVCNSRQFADGPENEEVEHEPYQNLFDPEDGVIIATYNWRPQDTQKKLQWSDIVFETYLQTLGPEQSVSNLQSVIQVDIINTGTFSILKEAYESISLELTNDDQWRKWTLKDQPYFFYALLGTDNVKGTVWLLNDHAASIGNKVISQIWTRGDPHIDIWIDIGPYDPQRDDE
ncbi:MAG: hypothetical protein Q9181_007221 [Wetmoreana brouardii]